MNQIWQNPLSLILKKKDYWQGKHNHNVKFPPHIKAQDFTEGLNLCT